MNVGQQVVTHTQNLLIPFVIGFNDKGKSIEIPVNTTGTISVIKQKQKKDINTIGVDFKFKSTRGIEQEITIFFKEKSLRPITN